MRIMHFKTLLVADIHAEQFSNRVNCEKFQLKVISLRENTGANDFKNGNIKVVPHLTSKWLKTFTSAILQASWLFRTHPLSIFYLTDLWYIIHSF